MENISLYITISAAVLFAGTALNRFSKFLKMPILLCFLGVGILFGDHGLNLLRNIDIKTVQAFGEVALCFIIFAGGLQTSFKSVKSVFITGTILSTIGVVLTALVSGVFFFWISHMSLFMTLSFSQALLVGAIFASTDAAAVFAILRSQKASISPKLQNLLEYESGSNDPAAFLLTSVMISVLISRGAVDVTDISWYISKGIVWGLGMGTVCGLLTGIFGQWFYNWVQTFLEYNGLRFVVAVAVVLFCYGITDSCVHANPLMACYVAGIVMGNVRYSFKNTFIRFHDGISWLMQIILFISLGRFFDFRMLLNFRNMTGAILAALALTFVARPLVVMLCMIKSPFTFRERLLTSWVGIRGSAPIMLAAMVVASNVFGPDRGANLFYCVFTVVLLSILIQGSTLMWAAKKLGLILPYKEAVENMLEYDERSDGREMCQFSISESSPLSGKTLDCSGLTGDPVLLMIKRGKKLIQPLPDVVLKAGDSLSFLGERDAVLELHHNFFPNEDYASPQTFRQIWGEFQEYWTKNSRKIKKHETERKNS